MCVPNLVLTAQAVFLLEHGQTNKQTDRQTNRQTETDAIERFTHAGGGNDTLEISAERELV